MDACAGNPTPARLTQTRINPARSNRHWIERTQITRYIRRLDRRLSIARLRLDETH
jgi:hypothetical protein